MVVARDVPNPIDPRKPWYSILSREIQFFPSYSHLFGAKLAECHPRFIASIREHGIVEPVRFRFRPEGIYIAEGHHRWVVARLYDLPVPWVDADEAKPAFNRSLPWADGYSADDD